MDIHGDFSIRTSIPGRNGFFLALFHPLYFHLSLNRLYFPFHLKYEPTKFYTHGLAINLDLGESSKIIIIAIKIILMNTILFSSLNLEILNENIFSFCLIKFVFNQIKMLLIHLNIRFIYFRYNYHYLAFKLINHKKLISNRIKNC